MKRKWGKFFKICQESTREKKNGMKDKNRCICKSGESKSINELTDLLGFQGQGRVWRIAQLSVENSGKLNISKIKCVFVIIVSRCKGPLSLHCRKKQNRAISPNYKIAVWVKDKVRKCSMLTKKDYSESIFLSLSLFSLGYSNEYRLLGPTHFLPIKENISLGVFFPRPKLANLAAYFLQWMILFVREYQAVSFTFNLLPFFIVI